MIEVVAVCRHPDGTEHPPTVDRHGFPWTCDDWIGRGAVLRWIIVDVQDDDG
jgi:hypothetical protein